MNPKRFTITVTAGFAIVLLLIGGTGETVILNIIHAQTTTLGEPFSVEKGKVTSQKEIGPNRTQYIFAANGTMNGNVDVTITGEFVSVSKGSNLTFEQGQGVITTKDGSETANYTFIDVFNGTDLQGASAYSTNSTGELSFLNNILGIFRGGQEEGGKYALEQWHWK
jgi:hypothetical protein